MGIRDDDGNQILTIGKVHAFVFRVAGWMIMLGLPALGVAMLGQRDMLYHHEWRISALERAAGGKGISQSVNVGAAGEALTGGEDSAGSGRVFLTVQEVAEREAVTDRAVTEWIAQGRLDPPPEKHGKAWEVARGYRILPQDTASFRAVPNGAEVARKEGQ